MRFTLAILLLIFTLQAHASRLVGQADFSVLWFDVYQAKLYHPLGQFDFANLPGTRLELSYKLDIKSKELVRETQKQWQKLGIEQDERHSKWLKELLAIWPDLKEGDALAFSVTKEGAGLFELNRQGSGFTEIGKIESQDFSRDFLAIWLAKRKEHQNFRLALLGEKE